MSRTVIKDPYDPRFPHGHTTGYSRGCHCDDCRYVNNKRGIGTALLRERGQGMRVDPAPVRAHIAALLAAGATYNLLASMCGIDRTTIRWMHVKGSLTVLRRNAEPVLAITPARVRAHLDALEPRPYAEAVRMVRSVQAHGWPLAYIAEQLGCRRGQPGVPLLNRPTKTVSKPLWDRIVALYTSHEARPGPSAQARICARRLGFYPPACYDEDGSLIKEARRAERYQGSDERRVLARWRLLGLILDNYSYGDAAAVASTSEKQVDRVMRRWGLSRISGGHYSAFAPGQEDVLALLRDAVAEVNLLVVDPIAYEKETAAAVATLRDGQAAQDASAEAA